ncbi:hypothetical protein [Noviherbaspirillum sp.]|jgi:membrane protein involved in colicin uptake|uniref:hypothetical protein n=1 Tax=Noviherbaspirillum sp. TaxID=1926288 RepID=UPI0025D8090E|nr:hypothetical protein [Noviherbaspirillum sp.]
MNNKLTVLATSLAFVFASSAYAQQTSGSSGTSGKQSSKQTIEQQHKAAIEKCNGMSGNAKDICKAEADGQKKISEAQAKLDQRDTPKNRLDLEEAKADADYKVAKERCDDQVGDAKNACQKEAKAKHNLALAEAKKQSQQKTSGSSATGTSSSGQGAMTGSSSAGTSGSSSTGQSTPSSPSSSTPSMPAGSEQSGTQPK